MKGICLLGKIIIDLLDLFRYFSVKWYDFYFFIFGGWGGGIMIIYKEKYFIGFMVLEG